MLFYLKKIASSIALPPTSLIFLALFGAWLTKNSPKAGRTLTTLALCCLLILSLPITGNALLHTLEKTPPISLDQLRDIEAIVILGGGTKQNAPEFSNQPDVNKWTLQRLRYGSYLQQLTGSPILVTGGAPFGGQPEAESMSQTLLRDFHAQKIWTEDQSKDSAENAAYCAIILKNRGISRIALVSDAWHLPRATANFRREGLTVYPAPTAYTPKSNGQIAEWLPSATALNDSAIALKEHLGMLMQNP